MSRFLKRTFRLTAFTALVLFVFLTNVVHKLGFSPEGSKDDGKKTDDLFASFTSVPSAYADTPEGSCGSSPTDGGCPNTDAGPCDGPAPH